MIGNYRFKELAEKVIKKRRKLEDMKKEIWEVVSKYMVVDDDFMEFEVRRVEDLTVLVSNIEVKDLSELTPAPTG